jgi:hypothetical protein
VGLDGPVDGKWEFGRGASLDYIEGMTKLVCRTHGVVNACRDTTEL